MFLLIVEVLNVIILIGFLPPNQEILQWLNSLGVNVSIAKFDVDASVSLLVKYSPNHYVILCLQFFTLLMDISL